MTKGNNETKTRGKPFQPGNQHLFKPGNPGRPKGARHKATLAVESLMEGQAEALTQKAISAALAGDMTALRLCLDRIAPPRKGRTIDLALPKIESPEDTVKALGALIAAMGQGDLTPDEAAIIAGVIETKRRAIETTSLAAEIDRLKGLIDGNT